MSQLSGKLTVEQLRAAIASGDVDTVVVAFTDMQGRLQGKRIHADFFLDTVLAHGTEGCNYLLAVDVDMNTVSGYAISSWEGGYGDMEFVLDLDTLRAVPWMPGTVMVQCDLAWLDDAHSPVLQSPRQILKQQADRAAAHGYTAYAGTELEFIVFDDVVRGRLVVGVPRDDAGKPIQRRLLAARHRARRTAAARDPQRHARLWPDG